MALANCSSRSSRSIRRFTTTDREALIATVNTVCAEGRWMKTLRYEPTPAWEHALAETTCPCHLLLVATDRGRIVGWCCVFPDEQKKSGADIAIGLLSEYREQGLGTTMVRQVITWARERGFMRLHLITRTDNDRAIQLFRKFGFSESRQLESGWMEMEFMLPNG